MSDKKRLVFVSGSYPEIVCGTSGHIRLVAGRMAARGDFDVDVLTSNDSRVDIAQAKGYRVHPQITAWNPRQAGVICRVILSLEPDIVHIQNPSAMYNGWQSITMSLVAPMLKRKAPQLRVVVMQHDLAISKPLWRLRYYPLFKAADAICVSNSRDEKALHSQGIALEKIYRTPVGPHMTFSLRTHDQYLQDRQRLGIDPEAMAVAHFGFVNPWRQIDKLILALYELRKKGDKIHGLILGGPSKGSEDYFNHCQTMAQKLGLASDIYWTGYATTSQIAEGLTAADACVCLAERGADLRNTSIMTAMMVGTPVITTRNPRYYVDHDLEKLGCLMVNSSDANLLQKAILQIKNTPPDQDLLVRNSDYFNPERIWSEHIKMNVRAYLGEPPT